MVAYLKAGPQVRTYLDYLSATREAEKEDLIELSQTSRTQTTDSPSKPRTTSFFPLRKLKGSLFREEIDYLAHKVSKEGI